MSACLLTEPRLYVRFDIWEQGNVSPLQLSDKLQGALRHALCDVLMELRVLPNPLCLGALCPATKAQREEAKGEVAAVWLFINSMVKVGFNVLNLIMYVQVYKSCLSSKFHMQLEIIFSGICFVFI